MQSSKVLLFGAPEDKEHRAEIMEKQLIKLKKEKIAGRAKEAMSNYKDGKIISGSIKELCEDLEGD